VYKVSKKIVAAVWIPVGIFCLAVGINQVVNEPHSHILWVGYIDIVFGCVLVLGGVVAAKMAKKPKPPKGGC
jgi:hypothetical protein